MLGTGHGYETHNDYLGMLVEAGLIGLIVTLLLYAALWSAGGRITRSAIVFIATTATFHNIINFRHYWIFLGLALVLDAKRRNVGEL